MGAIERRARLRFFLPLAAVLAGLLFAADRLEAIELLQNGGFESGTSPWAGLSSNACIGRGGNGRAGLISASASSGGMTQQTVPAMGGQSYTLSGYAKTQSGNASGTVLLIWRTSGIATQEPEMNLPLTLTADYLPFSISGVAPVIANQISVQ